MDSRGGEMPIFCSTQVCPDERTSVERWTIEFEAQIRIEFIRCVAVLVASIIIIADVQLVRQALS